MLIHFTYPSPSPHYSVFPLSGLQLLKYLVAYLFFLLGSRTLRDTGSLQLQYSSSCLTHASEGQMCCDTHLFFTRLPHSCIVGWDCGIHLTSKEFKVEGELNQLLLYIPMLSSNFPLQRRMRNLLHS